MDQLTYEEISLVTGGIRRPYDWVPSAQSDWGNRINDLSNMFGEWGSEIGIRLWDMTHRG